MRRPSPAELVFLRGRDADGRLRELGAARAAARPVLGELAGAFLAGRTHEKLGYRSLGDYAREKLGVGARVVREWARVWSGLQELPHLRAAVLSGEVSWTVARLVLGIVTPETDLACLETVRGRTVRAVKALIEAFREVDPPVADPDKEGDDDEGVAVRIPCDSRVAGLWSAALELARRVAGEALPVWQCAEQMAAEAASALGAPDLGANAMPPARAQTRTNVQPADESGLRAEAFAALRWKPLAAAVPPELARLVEGLQACDARDLGLRLRAATAFLQEVDFETGRILRQVQQRGLFVELGFESFARFAAERLDLAPRTARRLEDDVDAEAPLPRAIAFRAPPEAAELFLAMVAHAGSLERLLAHAIVAWVKVGECFDDYADFERDGFRCRAPGCTSRRNLHSHHIWFRGHEGPDVPWNRTTLCAYHHHRCVHGDRTLLVRGRAPDGLVFELGGVGGERYRSGDVRL